MGRTSCPLGASSGPDETGAFGIAIELLAGAEGGAAVGEVVRPAGEGELGDEGVVKGGLGGGLLRTVIDSGEDGRRAGEQGRFRPLALRSKAQLTGSRSRISSRGARA